MTVITTNALQTRTSPRALAATLLAAAVAAAMLVTEQWLEPWASRHQVGAWLALWAVGVAALLALRGLTRRAAQTILQSLDGWSARAARRRADERLWALAQSDARLMADLQAAMNRADELKEPEDLFTHGQRRADRMVSQRLYYI